MGWNIILSDHAGALFARVVDVFPRATSGGLALIIVRMNSHRVVHAGSMERKARPAVRTKELRDRRVVSVVIRCPVPLQP
jgi:hypothetical protein